MDCASLNLNLVTFNCHGLKSSLAYVLDLAKGHDILFINEHWLKENELYTLNDICDQDDLWCHLQSSVKNTDRPISGRPYGGIGFVCKHFRNTTYRVMNISSDRVLGLQVIRNHHVLLNIIGVYLPCHDSTTDTMDLYLQTLDLVQSILDTCDAPTVIMGDFNTTLPEEVTLVDNWYCKKPYKRRSGVLYDFISNNEMCVANFLFPQDICYTFKSVKGSSYIDHILIPTYMYENVLNCRILDGDSDNVSDHCAVAVNLDIKVEFTSNDRNPGSLLPIFPYPKWHDGDFLSRYADNMCEVMNNMPIILPESVSPCKAKNQINSYYNSICTAMHDSVKVSLITEPGNHRLRKRKSWWNQSCKQARDRNRLFHYVWKAAGRPTRGTVYDTYKAARKNYRKCCREAVNILRFDSYKLIEQLHMERNSRKMWNIIRKTKSKTATNESVSMDKLTSYFGAKFAADNQDTPELSQAVTEVRAKYEHVSSCSYLSNFVFPEARLRPYIRKLKLGSAAGSDGISAEHLKAAINSKLPLHLSALFTLCVRFGILPDKFCEGLLIPVLKKHTLNPSEAKNYRPITVSAVISKLLEQYILKESENFSFSSAQFGFISGRSTQMATVIAHDIGSYCVANGSSVYYCSLDAEGAFDLLPHCVLLQKSIDVIPDELWMLLHYWYSHMRVKIRSGKCLGEEIVIQRGTRRAD